MGIHTDTTLGPSRTPISQTPPGQGSIFDTSQNGTNGIFTHPSTWSSATAAAPTSTSPRGATWVYRSPFFPYSEKIYQKMKGNTTLTSPFGIGHCATCNNVRSHPHIDYMRVFPFRDWIRLG